ncbi:hypothetical protein BOTBODRAFT_135261 [Botryobasidium botryosum FD-172 SS1]|uniref:Uncharacterized protein n=1 Tax=Botryobasidium botryosum (strain FD-172 SS1) TaxID=930990 RepID=A0A067MB11_BOTB1|nr:hypothetical protein BOTBODRAFT_135261 [Botryobasidium botryosum FD-172 SS1]
MSSDSYWTSPATLSRSFEVAKLLCFVSIGLILCDTLHFASFDWSLIRGDRKRRWPQIPYFLVKVVWYVYSALNLAIVFAPTEINCQGVMEGIEFCMGTIVVCCSSLLAARTVCVYSGTARRVVSAVLIVLGLALTGTWMAGVPDVRAVWTAAAAQPWSTGGCNYAKVETRYFVKYLVTIVFDFTVLVLTIIGVRRMGRPRIGAILVNHGLIYFFISMASNLIVCVLTLLRLSPLMSLVGAVPSSCVSIMAATRLYVYLTDDTRPKNGGAITISQLSSSSSTPKKLASLIRNAAGKRTSMSTKKGANPLGDIEKGHPSISNGISVERSFEIHTDSSPTLEGQTSSLGHQISPVDSKHVHIV